MSRIPPALARRIDRLARHAHAFHRLAHHPLCQAYRPEVIALGRRARVCRGSALAAAGAAAGIATGLAAPAPPAPVLLGALIVFAAVALAAVRPPAGGRQTAGRGRSKIVSRLLPMALGGAVLSAGLASPSPAGLGAAAGVAAAVAAATIAYRRHGPDRTACLECPERALATSCSGYRHMAQRERAFQRLAGRWIAEAAAVPDTSAERVRMRYPAVSTCAARTPGGPAWSTGNPALVPASSAGATTERAWERDG